MKDHGISLDQAMNADKTKAAKQKDKDRWRPSNRTPKRNECLKPALGGSNGMHRGTEFQVLKLIDKQITGARMTI